MVIYIPSTFYCVGCVKFPLKFRTWQLEKLSVRAFVLETNNTYKHKSKFKTVSVYEVEIMNNRNISLHKSHTYHKFSNFIWKKMEEDVYIVFTKKNPKRLLSTNTLTKASTVKSADLVNIVYFLLTRRANKKFREIDDFIKHLTHNGNSIIRIFTSSATSIC